MKLKNLFRIFDPLTYQIRSKNRTLLSLFVFLPTIEMKSTLNLTKQSHPVLKHFLFNKFWKIAFHSEIGRLIYKKKNNNLIFEGSLVRNKLKDLFNVMIDESVRRSIEHCNGAFN